VNIFNPLDGEEIILYNIDRTKLGQLDIVDSNATDTNLRRQSYNGFELSVKARLPYGATMFGGWTTDRIVDVTCDRSDDPNTFRFCDQSILNIPFRSEFKIAGTVPAPGNFQINLAFQSYAGREIPTTWTLTRNTRYDNDCAGACQAAQLVVPMLTASTLSIRLTPPGTKFLERLNQLDLGVRKIFRVGKVRLSLQSDLFNAFNTSWIKSEVQVYGPTLGMPLDILQPRTLRLAMQYQF
jgi:hypothetical protein